MLIDLLRIFIKKEFYKPDEVNKWQERTREGICFGARIDAPLVEPHRVESKEIDELKELFQRARARETETIFVSSGGWANESMTLTVPVATLDSSASYQKAVKKARRILASGNVIAILEVHDILQNDPMTDIGLNDAKLLEETKDRLIELLRDSIL